jgi:hypothetical protein
LSFSRLFVELETALSCKNIPGAQGSNKYVRNEKPWRRLKQRITQGEAVYKHGIPNETVLTYGETREYKNNKDSEEDRKVTQQTTRSEN